MEKNSPFPEYISILGSDGVSRNLGNGAYIRPHFDKLRGNGHFSTSFTTFLVNFIFIKS